VKVPFSGTSEAVAMWSCSKCGEKIVEESDSCWNCGTVRDGAPADDSAPGPVERTPPLAQDRPVDVYLTDADLIDENEPDEQKIDNREIDNRENDKRAIASAEAPAAGPQGRPLTEAGFATVMLRLLGVYLTATALVSIVAGIGHIVFQVGSFELDRTINRYALDYFIHPVVEFLIGLYLLIGGNWVFNRLLTPTDRAPEDEDDWEDAESNDTSSTPASRQAVRSALRNWTSADGQFTTRARLLSVNGDGVVLLDEGGEELNVPLQKLCAEDRKYIEEHCQLR
jgi:hypothetical protein